MWLTTAGFEKFVSKVCCKHKCEKAGYCKGKAATAWKSHLSAVTTQHFRAALYAPAVSAATMSAALVSAAPVAAPAVSSAAVSAATAAVSA